MRILLAHNSLYYPSHGGGDKSNRLLMEALAARGHEVLVVSRIEKFGPEAHDRLLAQLEERGVRPEIRDDEVMFTRKGVLVHTLTRNPQWRAFFTSQLRAFDPQVIITSTDDPGHLLFEIARRASVARLVFLVRATIAVPFGPDSSMVSAAKTEALRDADGIVGVSEHVAAYVRQYGGLEAIHVPISLMDGGVTENLARFDNPYVVMVNPCAVKGISIFLALAERMPQLQFAGIPMWGTTAADLAAMHSLPNVTVIPPVDNVDELFGKSRVALVPSIWAEARSRVVMEAMLRGVPVLAADAGGLREAKMGVPYLLPVNRVQHYRHTLDENMVPVADVPPQDIGPWVAALDRLTTDQTHWEELSAESRQASLNYLRTLTAEPFEAFLMGLLSRPKRAAARAPAVHETHELSNDRRLVLARLVKQRMAEKLRSLWFPAIAAARPGELRLFCFPHAGGGTLAYRPWIGAMQDIPVTPVLLPGRETRLAEAPFESMSALVEALAHVIEPLLNRRYAFFGHSMGAGIAFELTRRLRRMGLPMPAALIVSSARAPQLRSSQPRPEPSNEELLAELDAMGGLPAHVSEHPEALQMALLPLQADTRLYRNYVYHPEPPLDVPIMSYGGAGDLSIAPEHLQGWRDQTTASFKRREFAGGHFYLRTDPQPVLDALREDLLASTVNGDQAGVTGAS